MLLPKIIIVDDHSMFRTGIRSLIEKKNLAQVLGEAGDGIEFLSLLDKYTPEIVLMDIEMPRMNGIEAVRKGLEKNPNINFIILSMSGDEFHYSQMIQAGVKGFILKTSGVSELEKAFKEVSSGGNYFSNELLRRIVFEIQRIKDVKNQVQLNERELEVLGLICNGLTNEEIAESIRLSVSSIKSYKGALLEKTGSKNTASLIVYAIKNKLIEI